MEVWALFDTLVSKYESELAVGSDIALYALVFVGTTAAQAIAMAVTTDHVRLAVHSRRAISQALLSIFPPNGVTLIALSATSLIADFAVVLASFAGTSTIGARPVFPSVGRIASIALRFASLLVLVNHEVAALELGPASVADVFFLSAELAWIVALQSRPEFQLIDRIS